MVTSPGRWPISKRWESDSPCFIASRLPAASEVVVTDLAVSPNGFSNETACFTASWSDGRGPQRSRYVLRCQGDGRGLFYETDLSLQWRMMEALAGRRGIPVPGLVWWEPDPKPLGVAFFVMNEVPGRVRRSTGANHHVTGWVQDLTVADRSHLYHHALEVLVRIHAVDWHSGFDFLARPAYGRPGLDQHLGWIKGWLEMDWPADDRSPSSKTHSRGYSDIDRRTMTSP